MDAHTPSLIYSTSALQTQYTPHQPYRHILHPSYTPHQPHIDAYTPPHTHTTTQPYTDTYTPHQPYICTYIYSCTTLDSCSPHIYPTSTLHIHMHIQLYYSLQLLQPSASEFSRALRLLNSPEVFETSQGGRYDGGDQAFWREFYSHMYELPARYHVHQALEMNISDWRKVRLVHIISGLRAVNKMPKFLRPFIEYFY